MSARADPGHGTASKAPPRRHDPAQTREDILTVATEEFAAHGLSGARVDAIAARTRTTKRAIYYYFRSKEELYLAVLERAYASIRAIESELRLEDMAPEAAIRRLVEFTFDHQDANPDFVRLVGIENIHRAEHLKRSPAIRGLNVSVIETIASILARGRHAGVFRAEVDPVDLHLLISAFCFFRVANRHTFGAIFDRDLTQPDLRARHKRLIGDAVIRLLQGAG